MSLLDASLDEAVAGRRFNEPSQTGIGTWSGGRFLPFGVPLEEERLVSLLRPGADLRTVLTSDVYGCGQADSLLGRSLEGVQRDSYCLIGAVGHDFYFGHRQGRGGFQRFTDPRLRSSDQYLSYLQMATERSLERLGVDRFDVLLLHNPDQRGYTSAAVWEGLDALRQAGLTSQIGIAPGPDNGFILDMIECFERFGELIDWAMLILNPFEPWPATLALPAAEAHGVKVITRVLDHGGVFWGDVKPGHRFPVSDHRSFRPSGWVEAANAKLEVIRPIAERHGLTPLQLAAAWNLAHPAVECVIPTLTQELGGEARPIEDKRSELAGVPVVSPLSQEEVDQIREIGDNTGTVPLKGASRQYLGEPGADQWPMPARLEAVAGRWGIRPDRDLYFPADLRDIRERGARAHSGEVQALDRRLFMQLQAFTGSGTVGELLQEARATQVEAVFYESVNDPCGVAMLVLDEDPDRLVTNLRLLSDRAVATGLERVPELSMIGRTYGSGHEPQLEDWLLSAPRRKLADPRLQWAIWYPLRRTGSFYQLTAREQGRILAEHGRIGQVFGQAGYAEDIRLECFALDQADNEFVIGLLGSRLDALSRLVKAMRSTEQTSRYIDRLGPFFVGRHAGHTVGHWSANSQ